MTNKIDLLSESIDKLNSGQTPQLEDTETADLLEVAALLQKSGLPAQPPEHILSATVQSAVDGLAQQSSRRRNSWMYSGILGAVAAFLLFIGIHGFPDIQEVAPIVSPSPQTASSPVTSEAPVIRAAAPPPAIANPAAEPPPAAKPEVSAPPQPAPSPSSAPRIAASAQPEHAPASTPPRLYKSAPAPAAKPAGSPQLAAVVLPGRSPESVFFDRDSGILRQVFARGTSQELTITQRGSASTEPLTTDLGASGKNAEAYAAKTNKALPFNKLVIIWNGQQITLEGPQTLQELATIAEQIRAANPEKKKP
jgi:hypothetical protein